MGGDMDTFYKKKKRLGQGAKGLNKGVVGLDLGKITIG